MVETKGVQFARARVIPFSSTVGGGLMLFSADGEPVGQLTLLNIGDPKDGSSYRDHYVATCQRVADLINAGNK